MSGIFLLAPILIPLAAGLLVLPLWRPCGRLREVIALLSTVVTLVLAIRLFGREGTCVLGWAGSPAMSPHASSG